MATILDPVTKAVHDAAAALLDQQVPATFATAGNSIVDASFGAVGGLLTIVRDLTAPAAPPPPP
jgi:hypothetical protein